MKNYTQFVTESVAPLSLRDFPITSHIDIGKGRSAEEILTHFFDVINPALQNSQIIKAQLKTIRDYASQIVDIGFRNISDRYVVGGKWKELPEVLQQYSMYGAEPANLSLITSSLKKAEAIKINHPYKNEVVALLKELQKIEIALNYLKGCVVARVTKSERESQAAYLAPQSTKDAKKLVSDVLTEMTRDHKNMHV